MAGVAKKTILVGVDNCTDSLYSLEWALDHLAIPMNGSCIPSRFKVIVLLVKPPASYVMQLAGPGVGDILTRVETDIKRIASSVGKMATDMCVRGDRSKNLKWKWSSREMQEAIVPGRGQAPS